MTTSIDKHGRLVGAFFLFIGIYVINLIVPLYSSISYTQRMWLLASLGVIALAIFVLFKEGLPGKKAIFTGLCLALLAGLVSPRSGIVTFFAFLGATRIFEATPSKILVLKEPVATSIWLGLGMGLVLGLINLFLSSGGVPNFRPSLSAFVMALNPGIHEEVSFRFFIYAFSIYLLGGEITSKKERVWVYVLMVIPHVLIHFPDQFFINGVFTLDLGTLLVGTTILSILFGLPLALSMTKRDLTTSMLAHTIIDFIRFSVYGLPF